MTKSQVHALFHVASGIIKDAKMAYPGLVGWDLDIERLTRLCQTRGLSVFTRDLPSLLSSLLLGLETGCLVVSGPSSRLVSKSIRVPKLFSGLWLRVFDNRSCLRQEADVNAITFLVQLLALGKRIEVAPSTVSIVQTVEKYHDIERSLPEPTYSWSHDRLWVIEPKHSDGHRVCLSDSLCFHPDNLLDFAVNPQLRGLAWSDYSLLKRIQLVADIVSESFATFEPVRYSNENYEENKGSGFKHGHGAVANRVRNHEKSWFTEWSAKLDTVFPYDICGKHISCDRDRPSNSEGSSRLIAVPKTVKGPRLIASEPAQHMWCQQLILHYLNRQISETQWSHFVDFSDQAASGELVIKSSADGTLATVDLSDASDRLSCYVVERIFRGNLPLLTALHAARTRTLKDQILGRSSTIILRKFASQGTATTFPVQTIVFMIIALAVSGEGEINERYFRRLRNHVRVYGDDIVIPSTGYARLCRAMELLHLKVNIGKSYVRGKYRESCGTDAWGGYNITPSKPRTLVAGSPESIKSLVDIANNLFSKGFWHASERVIDLIPVRYRYLPVRTIDSGLHGFVSFCGNYESHLNNRWNKQLQRYEVRSWSIRSKISMKPRDGTPLLLEFFSKRHDPFKPRDVSTFGVAKRKSVIRPTWEPSLCG